MSYGVAHMQGQGDMSSAFLAKLQAQGAQQLIASLKHKIQYSDKYNDDTHEYRHVILPKELAKLLVRQHLMSEKEWRALGVQQSLGWEHYMVHRPEPHVLCFKRPLPK